MIVILVILQHYRGGTWADNTSLIEEKRREFGTASTSLTSHTEAQETQENCLPPILTENLSQNIKI